jgi:predicted O-methyltransferase YrrM
LLPLTAHCFVSKNIAMKKTELKKLLNLMTAYQQSRVLFTIVELGIPKMLSGEGLTAGQVAKQKKIDPMAMERLLSAAAAIGLLKRSGNLFSNREATENFLVEGKEFYLGGQIRRQQTRSFPAWENLTEKLQSWRYGTEAQTVPETDDQGAEAMTEQHQLALFHGFALAKAFDFSGFRHLLDLGGGTGAASIALCQTFPDLKATIFELPGNARIARRFVKRNKLEKQISVVSGNFKEDPLPEGFDVALLANFMSVADAGENQKLLDSIHQKLPRGGACLLSGWIIDNSHLAPLVSVLFCLEDICWDAPDVERSEKVYTGWMKQAGFSRVKCRTYLEPTKMLYGFKDVDRLSAKKQI